MQVHRATLRLAECNTVDAALIWQSYMGKQLKQPLPAWRPFMDMTSMRWHNNQPATNWCQYSTKNRPSRQRLQLLLQLSAEQLPLLEVCVTFASQSPSTGASAPTSRSHLNIRQPHIIVIRQPHISQRCNFTDSLTKTQHLADVASNQRIFKLCRRMLKLSL